MCTLALGLVLAGCGGAASRPANPPATSLVPPSQRVPAPVRPVPPRAAGTSGAGVGARTSGSKCRSGNVLANVYHPYRLVVLAACVTVSGIVTSVRSEADGDTHFDLALRSSQRGYLDSGNYLRQHGDLVVEIVPADAVGCVPGRPPRPSQGSYDYGICTGADLVPPAVGEAVWVTGPWVHDSDHGWDEIHPAWAIGRAGVASSGVVTPPRGSGGASSQAGVSVQPASACTATMERPVAAPGSYDQVDVSGLPPNSPVEAVAGYPSGAVPHRWHSDGSGRAQIYVDPPRSAPAGQVRVTVVSGPVSCATTLTIS